MINKIEIGPTPSDENCAQVGSDRYGKVWRAECKAFINQIRRVCGNEPDSASLIITSNPHDFGTYHEVAVKYRTNSPEGLAYALKVESTPIHRWDNMAYDELTAAGVCTARGCNHDHPMCVEHPNGR